MKALEPFILCSTAGMILALSAASAQSPQQEICDRLWDRTQGARASVKAPYSAFLAQCGSDGRAAAARTKIVEIDRQIRAKQVAAEREKAARAKRLMEVRRREEREEEALRVEERRQEQARQEQVRQEQARQEQARQEQARQEQARQEQARQAAATPLTRGITVGNGCPLSLQVRFIFRTAAGLTQAGSSTSGAFWNIEPGKFVTLGYLDGSAVAATSDEIYFHVTDANGPWNYPDATEFNYGNEKFRFKRVQMGINSTGNFQFHFCKT